MKVCGGYDFPGSNSGIDLFALTGWIPEGFHLKRSEDFDEKRTWGELVSAHRYGDCLITVATGYLPEREAERAGLVPTHAYAVLDVRDVCGHKLLLLKNPWSHVRWKGRFSPEDDESWTPELKRALRYDRVGAMQFDNGIFWIDFKTVLHYFDSLYLNWNRDLFQHHAATHRHWPAAVGPRKDTTTLGYDPQYHIHVKAPRSNGKSSAVWLLLTRHVTVKEQEEKDDMFMALHVYNEGGSRIFYPSKPMKRGTYTNNPHSLLRFDVPAGTSRSYTIVVSQYEKTSNVNFTLDVFSMSPFQMKEIPRTLGHEARAKGKWVSPGGNGRHETFMDNPQYLLRHPGGPLRLRAETASASLNIRVFASGERIDRCSGEILTSGDYRNSFAFAHTKKNLPAGNYTVVISSWSPSTRASFQFFAESMHRGVQLQQLAPEGFHENLSKVSARGQWKGSSAAGCKNYGRFDGNPRHILHLSTASSIYLRLLVRDRVRHPDVSISVALFAQADGRLRRPLITANDGVYTNAVCGVVTKPKTLEAGTYTVVPSTFSPACMPATSFAFFRHRQRQPWFEKARQPPPSQYQYLFR